MNHFYMIFFVFISIFSFSGLVRAEWVKVASTPEDDAIFYVSSDSIRSSGKNLKTAWELVNHPNGTRDGYKSAKVQQEYDCNSYKVRMIYASTYSELDAKGEVIRVADRLGLPWQIMPKGSVAELTRNYICRVKEKK